MTPDTVLAAVARDADVTVAQLVSPSRNEERP